jgi:hypothetical protein
MKMKLRISLLTVTLALIALGEARAQVSQVKPTPATVQQVQPAPRTQQSAPLVRSGESHSAQPNPTQEKREELCRKLERRQLELRRREQREVLRQRRENQ